MSPESYRNRDDRRGTKAGCEGLPKRTSYSVVTLGV